MTQQTTRGGKPLTGRKVFFIIASAFAVIIGVNVFMAVSAVRTFPGLEVKNSYVASQQFDELRAAQEALGWTIEATVENGALKLAIMDSNGLPAEIQSMTALLGRPTHVQEDQTPEFTRVSGVYTAPVDLNPGYWVLRIEAVASDDTLYRKRLELYVSS